MAQKSSITEITKQLSDERKLVSSDSYDLSVRQLLDMFNNKEIDVAPEYQRQFIWNNTRQSALIESILLGIPIPSLFMATNTGGTWEVVDGVQRLSTLISFGGNVSQLQNIGRSEPLRIENLEKLDKFNGYTFDELPKPVQFRFTTRPMRVTALDDKADLDVRYELFERLNTGGVLLHPQEIRHCVYRGGLVESLRELAEEDDFKNAILLKESDKRNGTKEEMVLRFLAFLENYTVFDHSVEGFLNDFMKNNYRNRLNAKRVQLFRSTFRFISEELPKGIMRAHRRITPVNLYEAIAVGAALAIRDSAGQPKVGVLRSIINHDTLRSFTLGATNSNRMVKGRIEFVKNRLINKK